MSRPELVVFSRAGCHLCDIMIRDLEAVIVGQDVGLKVVDIESSSSLADRYGERIPVLEADGEEICHYHLDRRKLLRWLQA